MDLSFLRERLDRGEIIEEVLVQQVLDQLIDILLTEMNVVTVQSPVIICGDIHGQYEDLIKLFRTALQDSGANTVRDRRWIFMGDYVDRGRFSVNTFLLLATHKLENPQSFFLLRGNHESRMPTMQYGFMNEIVKNYSHTGVWTKFMEVFDLLPIAALTDNNVFSIHGGLSPELTFVSDVQRVNRRKEIPETGLIADLTWSDPDESRNLEWKENTRGAGWIFGRQPTERFCWINGLQLITRSHQLVQVGFKWYFERPETQGSLINVWSAPNYQRSGNIASVLRLRFPGKEEFNLPTFDEEKTMINEGDIPFDPNLYFA
jgi:diadenosine tetraphosphatase ApaH/serine/threonine PP2A family protein phosphatase